MRQLWRMRKLNSAHIRGGANGVLGVRVHCSIRGEGSSIFVFFFFNFVLEKKVGVR